MGDRTIETDFWGDTQVLTKKRKKRKLRRWVRVLFMFVFMMTVLGFFGYTLADNWLSEGLGIATEDPVDTGEAVTDTPSHLTLLMLGVDRRGNEPARSDTIIVAFLDLETKQTKLLSIPRDTLVSVPGYRDTKINHAHAYGGPDLTAEAISEFIDVPVSKYVALDFDGFRDIVDILGGVTLDIDQRMYHPSEGIDLYPGEGQHLDGDKALQFVRYRGKAGDIGRIENQQKFLRTFADQAISLGTVVKLPSLIKEIGENTETNLTLKEMIGLAKIAQGVREGQIETYTLPGEPVYIGGVSYWEPYEEETSELIDEILARNETPEV